VSAMPSRVIVTGASRGIGRAVADLLARQGSKLAVVGRDRATLASAADEREGHVHVVADLSEPSQAEHVVNQAVRGLGGIDAVVSAAGIVHYQAALSVTDAELDAQLRVNAVTPFRIAQHAAPHMQSGGSFVFVTSTLVHAPAPVTAAYAASKAALTAMMRALALELGPQGIRANAVAPGVIDTDMVRVPRPGSPLGAGSGAIEQQLDALRSLHPLQRLGKPEEVAASVLYLLCAPFVTGITLNADGGLSLGRGIP